MSSSSDEKPLIAEKASNKNKNNDENQQLVKQEKEKEKENKITYELKTFNLCGKQIDLPLVALMLNNFLLNAACSVINPFFPPLAIEAGLSKFQTGLVIGMHPACGFIFGMFMSKYLMNLGRKKVMLWSIIVTILTCFIMGVSYYLKEEKTIFFIVNLIARGFMGMARSGYGSATFAYAPMLWPQKVEKMIGLLESATGLGLLFGPLIGAAVSAAFTFNAALEYQMSFYVLCLFFACFVYPSYTMLPEDQKIPPKQQTLSLMDVLGRRQIWTLFFMLTLVSTSITFTYELWTELLATYGIGTQIAAVYMTAGSMTYIIALQFIPRLMKHYIRNKGMVSFRKILETCGGLICIVSTIFMAPETGLGIPQRVWPLVTGMFICGFGQAFAILPYIPEQNMNVIKFYPKQRKLEITNKISQQVKNQMQAEKLETGKDFTQADVEANAGEIIRKLYSDMAAGMFMSAYSLGTFAGPTIGGLIVDIFEHSNQCQNVVCGEYDGEEKLHCQYQYGFKQIARIIYCLLAVFTTLYVTLGQGYIGWRDMFFKKKPTKDQMVLDKPLKHEPDTNLTDALITDTDNQFTDAENQLEYDEETEQRLAQIKKKSDAQISADSGSARSSAIMA